MDEQDADWARGQELKAIEELAWWQDRVRVQVEVMQAVESVERIKGV